MKITSISFLFSGPIENISDSVVIIMQSQLLTVTLINIKDNIRGETERTQKCMLKKNLVYECHKILKEVLTCFERQSNSVCIIRLIKQSHHRQRV